MRILKNMYKVSKLTLAAFIFLSCSAYAQQMSFSSTAKNNPDGSQTLLNHVPQEVATGLAAKISHADSNQVLNLRILLPSKDQAGLDNFIKELSDPKSPNYHQFLTPQQFDLQFGASSVNSSIVIGYLKSLGLTVQGQSQNGFIITVIGPVSKVESAFKLNINNYQRTDGTTFFAPDVNPTIAVQVAGKITAISGLDNAVIFQSFSHRHTVQPVNSLQGIAASGARKIGVSPKYSGPDGFLGPQDIFKAYNLNSVTSTGSGQTLAVFELGGYAPSDINVYKSFFSLPGVPLTNHLIDGFNGVPNYNDNSANEVTLDIEIAMGIAQGLAGIAVYEAPNTTQGWEQEWTQIATDDTAKVISCSWGEAEQSSPTISFDNATFQEMAGQGQSVFVASGDSGAFANGSTLSVNDPASVPYATSVGISVLTTNGDGTYNNEIASSSSGGGISSVWSIPAYQSAVAAAAPGASMVSTTMRNVPDLSLTADDSTPYDFYINGSWGGWWGSSIASPIWAAFTSRVNQGRVAAGLHFTGLLNTYIYQIAQSGDYASDFHDISSGNNGFYPAVAGYDDATGLGSFNGANLYNELVGSPPPTDLIATPGNAQVVLNWAASPGANGYYVLRSIDNGGPYSLIFTTGTTNVTDTPVNNGTTYYYVVQAVNAAQVVSANSSQVSATPLAPTVPSPPTTVSAVSGPSDAQATVTFSGALANGSAITGYTVTSNPGGIMVPGASSPITVPGLTDGISYTFTVTATNNIGTSGSSNPSNSVISGSPTPPTVVSAVYGDNAATVTFSGASPIGSAIILYTVTSSPAGGLTNTGATSPITVTSLTNGTPYTFTVTATNMYGTSVSSIPSNSVIPAGPPLAPTVVTAVPGNGAATVTFSGALPNGSVILSYTVTSSPPGGSNTGATSPITVSGLTNGTSYTFTVTATNIAGTGAPSNPSNSGIAGSPLPPTVVSAASGNASAIVTFSGATANGSPITLYTVTSSPAGGLTNTGATSPITVTSLTNGTPYTFTVTAANMYGTSAASISSNSVTPTAVVSPTNLKATILGARVGGSIIYGGVSLTWKQSISPGVVRNKIYRSTGPGSVSYSLLATVSASTSFKDINVSRATVYNYVVTALNSNGSESNYSAPATVNY